MPAGLRIVKHVSKQDAAVKVNSSFYNSIFFIGLYQWPIGSAFENETREVPGSFLGRACEPSRSEISVIFSETN